MRKIGSSGSGIQKPPTTETKTTTTTTSTTSQPLTKPPQEQTIEEKNKPLPEEIKSQRKGDKQLSGLMKQSVFQGALNKQQKWQSAKPQGMDKQVADKNQQIIQQEKPDTDTLKKQLTDQTTASQQKWTPGVKPQAQGEQKWVRGVKPEAQGRERSETVFENIKPEGRPRAETQFTDLKTGTQSQTIKDASPKSLDTGQKQVVEGRARAETQFENIKPEGRPRSETVFENIKPEGRPRAETQFENLEAPKGRPRAMGHSEKTLPEPALDIRKSVGQSRIDERLSPDSQSTIKKNNQSLQSYHNELNQPISSKPEERRQQFLSMDKNLTKLTNDPQLGAMAKKESQLLQDTVKDGTIMNSAYLKNANHAMELKRLGMQPSVAGKIGEFTDVRLEGDMKKLGSGNLNTVYIGKYNLPDGKGSYEGVFKPEVKKWDNIPIAGAYSGIDEKNPRAGYRNVATTRLDEALGFNNLTTRSEMALHKGELGTVSEKAPGVAPKGSSMLSNEKVPPERIADLSSPDKGFGSGPKGDTRSWLERYNAERGESKAIGEKIVDGKKEYFYEGNSVRNINYSDPKLRQDLTRLQLMDSISGQVDRHNGNYFVQQDKNGKCLGVKGIDNDLSWGKNLKQVQDIKSGDLMRPEESIHLPKYLPPVVDKQAYDSIMKMDHSTFQQKMGGLLTTEEMGAANDRLKLVQDHLKDLNSKGRVLNNLDDWSKPEVTNLLMEKKNGGHTSYISRDYDLQQRKQQQGLLVPYDYKG